MPCTYILLCPHCQRSGVAFTLPCKFACFVATHLATTTDETTAHPPVNSTPRDPHECHTRDRGGFTPSLQRSGNGFYIACNLCLLCLRTPAPSPTQETTAYPSPTPHPVRVGIAFVPTPCKRPCCPHSLPLPTDETTTHPSPTPHSVTKVGGDCQEGVEFPPTWYPSGLVSKRQGTTCYLPP